MTAAARLKGLVSGAAAGVGGRQGPRETRLTSTQSVTLGGMEEALAKLWQRACEHAELRSLDGFRDA